MSDIKRSVPAEEEAQEPAMAQPPMKKKHGVVYKVVVILIILLVISAGLFLVSKYTSLNILGVNKNTNATGWQAVFLSNGQVYFGKVAKKSSDTLTLKDIYYLQVTQQIQPSGEEAATDAAQQNLSLVKLGNELHGPKDEMRINRSQVMFVEDLKEDSRVVDAIVRYIEDQE